MNTRQPKPEYFMHQALQLAQEAAAAGEVPVGAVVVNAAGEIIGRGRNSCIGLNDPTAHAEILALREAGQKLANYRLIDCSLFVTLEPCTQCFGALINARISKLYFAAKEPRTGVLASVCNLANQPWYNHKIQVESGLLQGKSKQLLKNFFAHKR